MAFVGNLLGGYQAREIGKYNESILQQQAAINTRNAEIKKTIWSRWIRLLSTRKNLLIWHLLEI